MTAKRLIMGKNSIIIYSLAAAAAFFSQEKKLTACVEIVISILL
jgi:hypothetical protein